MPWHEVFTQGDYQRVSGFPVAPDEVGNELFAIATLHRMGGWDVEEHPGCRQIVCRKGNVERTITYREFDPARDGERRRP